MNVYRSGFAAFLLAAIGLAGCAGPAVGPAGDGGSVTPARMTPASSSSGDLLYVAETVGAHHQHGVVSIVTFPQGTPVARIAGIGYPRGVCADAAGNVWVIAYPTRAPIAYEFAHGGTTPIAQIALPPKSFAAGCSVDPTTGNLAIANDDSAVKGQMLVYPGAKSGKPLTYRTSFEPLYCTYDGSGDLFADGIVGSTAFFVFGELPVGAKRFKQIDLKIRFGFPGGLAWDGQYVALQSGEGAHSRIYRLQVTSSGVQVAQTVKLVRMAAQSAIAIDGGSVAGFARYLGARMDVWPYPAGGRPSGTLGRFHDVSSLAISKASN